MFSFLSDYISQSPRPVTYGASFLYPGTDVPSDGVVVGFIKSFPGHEDRLYMEYGIDTEKYFMIYQGLRSRQVRRPGQEDFLTTGAEFDSWKNDSEQYGLYQLDRLQASRLFQKVEDLFFKNDRSDRAREAAFATALDDLGYQPVQQSTFAEREAAHRSLARLTSYGRVTQQSVKDNLYPPTLRRNL